MGQFDRHHFFTGSIAEINLNDKSFLKCNRLQNESKLQSRVTVLVFRKIGMINHCVGTTILKWISKAD